MCYTVLVAKTRVRPTALPATSHPLGHNKKSHKSNHCHTSAIFSRNSFACHTYKNKGLKVLCLPHIFQIKGNSLVMVNQVAA
jgi:hypothetical protein